MPTVDNRAQLGVNGQQFEPFRFGFRDPSVIAFDRTGATIGATVRKRWRNLLVVKRVKTQLARTVDPEVAGSIPVGVA